MDTIEYIRKEFPDFKISIYTINNEEGNYIAYRIFKDAIHIFIDEFPLENEIATSVFINKEPVLNYGTDNNIKEVILEIKKYM